MTQQEWEQEFNNLLDDMTMQDGRAILAEPDQNSPTYASWCKLYAVFGDNYTCSTRDSGERASRIPCFVYLRFWAAILYGITPKIVNSLEVGNRKRLLMHRQSSLLLPHAACRVNPRLFYRASTFSPVVGAKHINLTVSKMYYVHAGLRDAAGRKKYVNPTVEQLKR